MNKVSRHAKAIRILQEQIQEAEEDAFMATKQSQTFGQKADRARERAKVLRLTVDDLRAADG